jgi:hypothetical protein
MKKLYALALSVMVVMLMLGSFSNLNAQNFTLGGLTVRTVPNSWTSINGAGTEVVSLRNQPYGYFLSSEITTPFPIRYLDWQTSTVRIGAAGQVILSGPGAAAFPVTTLYDYGAQYGQYDYWYQSGSTIYHNVYYDQVQGPYYNYGQYCYNAAYAIVPWGSFLVQNDGTHSIWHEVSGTSPNRVWTVEASNQRAYYSSAAGSWQVKFYENGTNNFTKIRFYYFNKVSGNWSYPQNYGSYGYNYNTVFGIRNNGTSGYYSGTNGLTVRWATLPAANTIMSNGNHYYTTDYAYNDYADLPSVGVEFSNYLDWDLSMGNPNPFPGVDAVRSRNVPFSPSFTLANEGKNSYSSGQARCRITMLGTGIVYDQVVTFSGTQIPAPFSSITPTPIVFPSYNPTDYGVYNIQFSLVTATPTWPDNNTGNDSYTYTITVSPDNDLRGVSVITPTNNSRTPVNVPMPIEIRFQNSGVLNQPTGRITAVVKNPMDVVVYRDTVTLADWASGQYRDTAFRNFTPTTLGEHTLLGIAILGNDQLRINDTISAKVLVRYEADVRAVAVFDPEDDGEKPEGKSFQPVGIFESVGVRDLFDIRARVQIRKCSDNSLVYQADSLPGIPELNIDEGQKKFAFPAKQGIFDIKNLPAGCYKMCVIALLSDDGDRTNDTACTFFSFIPKLKGNIEVGVGRRFKTISGAVDSMRYRGIGGHLNLILTDNTYSENGATSVSTGSSAIDFTGIEGTSATSIVTWKPKVNVFPVITFTGNKTNCFNFSYNSAPWMVFDGNNQSFPTPDDINPELGKRGITINNQSSVAGVMFNLQWGRHHMTFKNMNLNGNGNLSNIGSSIFTTSNVYDNNSFLLNQVRDTAPNQYITIENNFMGNAAFGVRDVGTIPLFNIGKAVFEDRRNNNNKIARNNIGSQTRPIGLYGVYFVNEDGLKIERNEISFVGSGGGTLSAGVAHLEIGPLGAPIRGNSVNTLILGNKIHNVGGGSTSSGVYIDQASTIYVVGSGPTAKVSTLPVMTNNVVASNFIYDLRNGATKISPIYFNTTSALYTTENDSVFNNSLTVANSASMITVSRAQRPFLYNNIVGDRNLALNASAVVYELTVPRPWQKNISSDHNLFDLLNSGRFATVNEYDRATGTAIQTRNIVSLNDWRTLVGQDINAVTGDARFTTDSLHLPEATSYIFSPASNAGKWLGSGSQRFDIDGDERLLANGTPDIGADEFEGFQWTNDLAVQVITQPSGLTNGSGAIIVTEENPLNIQAIVRNMGALQALDRKVWAKIDTSRTNGVNWVNIYTAAPNEYDFDVAQSIVADFAGANVVPQPNTLYRVTVWVGNDQNNANNSLSKTFTLTLKREAVLVSYESTTVKGLQNKDSLTRALRRLGVKFDSLDRAAYGANFIDYAPWWTLIWSTGTPTQAYNTVTVPGTTLGVAAVSLKETEEIVNFLRAGQNYAKKSFVIGGQNVAQFNDPLSGGYVAGTGTNTITNREFMDQWMHTRYKAAHPGLNFPVSVPTLHRGLLKGTGVYFIFNDSISAGSPDVLTVYPVTATVGSEVSRYAYNYNTHPATPLDSGAATAWTSPNFNVVFYGWDWADAMGTNPLTEAGNLTSGTTRFVRGALDFIQSFKGTVLPVEFVNVKGAATATGNEITWQVAAQKNVDRYEVEVLSGDNWNFVGDVKATNTKNYSFIDNSASAFEVKNFTYRVTNVDLDGARSSSPAVTFGRNADGLSLSLEQNFPNPFNGSTKINYTLPENGTVSIRVMDMTGKMVENLINAQELSAGKHDVTFTTNAATGNYVYEVSFTNAAGETQRISKMMTLTK